MRDPFTLIGSFGPFSLWHRDKGGRDGACGWFMRANHGDPEVLKRIESRFAFDWARSLNLHDGTTSQMGFFTDDPYGWPAMSIHAIALNLFFLAALEHFGSRKRAVKFLNEQLFEILLFAENPSDSPAQGWLRRYGVDEREDRKERISENARMVYGWILRASRPWYRHPRWHMNHWRLTMRWFPKLSEKILS